MSTMRRQYQQMSHYVAMFDYKLDTGLAELRDYALTKHGTDGVYTVPTVPLIDAQTWLEHPDQEDWLLWRAHRTASRLRRMPIYVSPGEIIVGRPDLRVRTPEEELEFQQVRETLETIPPFPGGDPGHFQPNYQKLLACGIGGMLDEISEMKNAASGTSPFYQACTIALEGMSAYVLRVADEAEMAGLPESAGICRRIAHNRPETFAEAMQLIFLTLIALWFGEDHGLTCPGRLDQTLNAFYEADIAAGRITLRKALDLICNLYIHLNIILYPGSAVAVMVGGTDADKRPVENELTYLCLIARKLTQLAYPTVGLAWHEGTSENLMDFACRMIATGVGDPAFFNDEVIAKGLRDHGVSDVDSYNYMNSTCVEIKPVGSAHIWVTAPYFNCPKALLDTMDKIAEGTVDKPTNFDAFNSMVMREISHTVGGAAEGLDKTWAQRGQTGGFPLASCFIDDCIKQGIDFDRGGARYNWVENSFVGLANLVDGLITIKHYVFEQGKLSISDFRTILAADFVGYEALRAEIDLRMVRYGNDDDSVDQLAVQWASFLQDMTESHTVGLHRYVPGFFCWVVHERFGAETGATPDGRPAGFPLADGAGAAQGREHAGPTSSILSTTKWDHTRAIGGLVHNVKFSKSVLRNDGGLSALKGLLETYLRRGGFEIQVNAVSADELRDAQRSPERYGDLLIRVAGYSDYFVHLNSNMQDEVIKRTEHAI